MSNRCAALLVVSFFVASLPAGAMSRISVDCDAGDDLGSALESLEARGGGRVHVTGVCVGPFAVSGESPIEIIGDSPATAILDGGGSGAAISATNPGTLTLRDLRLTGGIVARGERRGVSLSGCEIDSGVSVWSGASVGLVDSTVTGNRALGARGGGVVSASRTILHDCTVAAEIFTGGLYLNAVDVRDCVIGVLATDRSTVEIRGGSFADGVTTRITVERDSRLTLIGTQLGAPDDELVPKALRLDQGSSAEIFSGEEAAVITGRIDVENDSYLTVAHSTIRGSIHVSDFSRLRFDGTLVDGAIVCEAAADAWCGRVASTRTFDCPSAPETCTPAAP